MLWFYSLIFAGCCVLLYFSGEWVIVGLLRLAKFLGWREFVVAFFVMAFAASLPNLFVGLTSAFKGIPELSFGDIAGNSLVALTLGVGLATLFTKKCIVAESKVIQTTSLFTLLAAVLPLILIWDGELSRIDGIILILLFAFYCSWLFCKKERFSKIYDQQTTFTFGNFKTLVQDLLKILAGITLLIVAAQGIVLSAQFFSHTFDLPLILIGVLITGLGSALPEIYFAVSMAKKGENWMVLGDLMGAVIVPSTLILGIVILIHPIKILDFSPFAIARLFLMVSTLLFFIFVRTNKCINKKEAFCLISIYVAFLLVEILAK